MWTKVITILIIMIIFPITGYTANIPVRIGGTNLNIRVHSFKDLRDGNIVKQKLDYSCGAASLATLLTYYFAQETSEQDILDLIIRDRSEEEIAVIKERGFSLFDLKFAAETLGYNASGFKMNINHLKKLTGPVIVYITPRGYQHFAVFKGIRGDRIYLADPTRGNIRLSVDKFLSIWNGVTFVLGNSSIEEGITSYPLMVDTKNPIQPEVFSLQQMLDISHISLPIGP
jgi:predicted double-glycine peptidase